MPNLDGEQEALDQFRTLCSEFPVGEVVKGESPDFSIVDGDAIVGIEIREVFQGPTSRSRPQQAQEREKREVLARAQTIAENSNLPGLTVGVLFRDTSPIRNSEKDDIANALVSFVKSVLPIREDSISFESDELDDQLLQRIVTFLIVSNSWSPSIHNWTFNQAGFYDGDPISTLQAAISHKAGNFPRYQMAVAECWLLLWTDDSLPAGFVYLNDDASEHEFHSPFSRTFLLNSFRNRLLELKTANRPEHLREDPAA